MGSARGSSKSLNPAHIGDIILENIPKSKKKTCRLINENPASTFDRLKSAVENPYGGVSKIEEGPTTLNSTLSAFMSYRI